MKKVDGFFGEKIKAKMGLNPDEEWLAERNQRIASLLPKGQAGNGSRLCTKKNKSTIKDAANEILLKWKFEKDLNW